MLLRAQIFSPDDRIDMIDDHYWQVRAEAVPPEEVDPPSHSRRIHVYHFSSQNNNTVSRPDQLPFGHNTCIAPATAPNTPCAVFEKLLYR